MKKKDRKSVSVLPNLCKRKTDYAFREKMYTARIQRINQWASGDGSRKVSRAKQLNIFCAKLLYPVVTMMS